MRRKRREVAVEEGGGRREVEVEGEGEVVELSTMSIRAPLEIGDSSWIDSRQRISPLCQTVTERTP